MKKKSTRRQPFVIDAGMGKIVVGPLGKKLDKYKREKAAYKQRLDKLEYALNCAVCFLNSENLDGREYNKPLAEGLQRILDEKWGTK